MARRLLKFLKRMMMITVGILALLAIIVYFFMQQPNFGSSASGERLKLVRSSPHFRDGAFQNVHETPQLTEGYNMATVLWEFLFKRKERRQPNSKIPSMKTDLRNLPQDQDVLVWFGHSSYFMQIDGMRFLVDPVFSGNASPVPGSNKAFEGTDPYSVSDLPEIDYLIITHDHYDHADYETLVELKAKVKYVICGLGVGAHFESWGYAPNDIIERDWNQQIDLGGGFKVVTATARHFSGRGFKRNNTLWMSYLLQTPGMKIYIGGDSGYDTHFAEIGNKYGPVDLAILENGQYDQKWKYIHMLPDEVLKAGQDLKASRVFPVHSGKFAMANHSWDEPLEVITKLNIPEKVPLITPIIGQPVDLRNENETFSRWWENVQ